jgi:putative redox protein
MPSAVAIRRKSFEHEVRIREHRLIADEPPDKGGGDAGPKPTELLAASLATCAAVTIEMYADRKEWELGALEVAVDYEVGDREAPSRFDVRIKVPVELSDEQREKLLVIAGKCPVHRTLAATDVEVNDSLEMLEP